MERTKERIKLETEMLRFILVAMVALLIERLPGEKP
jgi:hypothetical protein